MRQSLGSSVAVAMLLVMNSAILKAQPTSSPVPAPAPAPVPAPPAAPGRVSPVREIVEAILPTIKNYAGPKPAAVSALDYAETQAFDAQLHQSLAAHLPAVNVNVGGAFLRNAVPPRAAALVEAIKRKHNIARTCVIADDTK